jgi:predicted esterase
MQSNPIEIRKTARYWTHGTLSENTQQIWIVCHGYGQLAAYFLKKFEGFNSETHFVIAPEALSRFYLEGGFAGKVGATWMTKEDRLAEISDYVAYLNAVYQQAIPVEIQNNANIRVKLLGFSQGVATVCRWAFAGQVRFDELILWAGGFPHDLDYSSVPQQLEGKKVWFIYGEQDELIRAADFEAQLSDVQAKGIHPEIITFTGKHELNEEVLRRLS